MEKMCRLVLLSGPYVIVWNPAKLITLTLSLIDRLL